MKAKFFKTKPTKILSFELIVKQQTKNRSFHSFVIYTKPNKSKISFFSKSLLSTAKMEFRRNITSLFILKEAYSIHTGTLSTIIVLIIWEINVNKKNV